MENTIGRMIVPDTWPHFLRASWGASIVKCAIGKLNPRQFENLVFDLVQAIGLKNAVWRTPGRDGGRDIQGDWFVEDLSGYVSRHVWYIECKRLSSSASWPTVWEKISFAESNGADVLLFAVTSSLSPQATDEVNKWNEQKKAPRIRIWNGFDIEARIRLFSTIAVKYGLAQDPRMQVGSALLPVTSILLKYSIAAHSSEVFRAETSKKLAVVYALAELVSARLNEVEKHGKFCFLCFRVVADGFDWLGGASVLESYGFDKYSLRALVSYLRDATSSSTLEAVDAGNGVRFPLAGPLSEAVSRDLRQIALLSNFETHAESGTLTLRPR